MNEVFLRYTKSNEDGRMTSDELMKFHKEEQGVELLRDECIKIIQAFEPKPGQTTLSMEGNELPIIRMMRISSAIPPQASLTS